MKKLDWNLWNNITFKTQGYRKNFDMINVNENFITEYDGTITEIRINNRKPPRPIGEYGFSVWNIGLGKRFAVDFNKLIKEHSFENTYAELIRVIKKKEIDIKEYKKIVLVHTFILHKDYRKHGIVEEFVEMLYRDFYCEGVAIIMLVKPFQDNPIDADFYFNRKQLVIRDSLDFSKSTTVSATEYYSLNELIEKKDTELNEYKLFAIANRCGFQRINESYLFLFSPEKTEARLLEKQKFLQHVEDE
jgi:hypothetical protein